jgi:hypothetical protein
LPPGDSRPRQRPISSGTLRRRPVQLAVR